MLIRLDPKRNRIAVLSLPRDLAVTIPGVADNTKINQAYDEGGAPKTLDTVKYLFESATGEKFPVNSVIDVNFNGFQQAVNYVKGVYVDVDRDYNNPEGTGYAAIDIKAGYQRLVGSDALAYVRYRHTDSDIFRNARQQDFLRQAVQPAGRGEAQELRRGQRLHEPDAGSYFRFDKKFLTRKNIAGLLKTGDLARLQPRAGQPDRAAGDHRGRRTRRSTPACTSPTQNIQAAYDEFMTGEGTRNPKREKKVKKVKKPAKASTHHRPRERAPARRGHGGAGDAAPEGRSSRSTSRSTARTARPTPTAPRASTPLRDEKGKLHRAYRIVIYNGAPGEYYGVQGQTWQRPAAARQPRPHPRDQRPQARCSIYDGTKLRQVAWRTPRPSTG